MPALKQIMFAFMLICALLTMAAAQQSPTVQSSSLTIIANATGDRVRITAPSSVVQMHLEVLAASGNKVFDEELRGANVFDWHLQDGQAHRLPVGDYVCVVTAKSVSGKLSQKIGAVTVAENSASVRPLDSQQLSLPQTQAIGPVEENSSWTIATKDEPQTPTVIANDGKEGQMIRGRGALTFRIGNFFSGIDTEQMRLTEEGNLGIGTSTPQSKLDVAGTIRAERFLVVKPNVTSGDKTAAGTQTSDAADSIQPLVAGTGTQNHLAKWLETGGAGTLGDSGVTEVAGNVGIGTADPGAKLEVNGTTIVDGQVQAKDMVGTGDQLLFNGILAGAGRKIAQIHSSDQVGLLDLSLGDGSIGTRIAGNGNSFFAGNVGIGTTGPGAKLEVSGNTIVDGQVQAKDMVGTGDQLLFNGILAGAGRKIAQIRSSDQVGLLDLSLGDGSIGTRIAGNGNSFFSRGNVGIGTTNPSGALHINAPFFAPPAGLPFGENGLLLGTNGLGSYKWIQSYGGPLSLNPQGNNVGIGTNNPAASLDVVGDVNTSNQYRIQGRRVLSLGEFDTTVLGADVNVPSSLTAGRLWLQTGTGTTGASVCFGDPIDSYSLVGQCVSSRRYKTNIARLGFGLDLVRRLRPITFDWKEGGKHDLGLIAEDVAAIEPLLVTYDSKGQVQGVKYDRVGVVLVNAVQEQQAQISQQQERLERQEEQIRGYQKLARQQQAMLSAQQQQLAGLKKIVCRSHRRCA